MALINTKDPYIFILAEEVRKNARAEIASLQYSRNRLLYSNNPKDIMTINAYNFRIDALKQYEKDAKTIVKEKKRIEKTTDDPKERQELLEDYAENVNLETIRKLKFASKRISSEQKTKLNEDYFKSPTNNTGTNASNKHVTFDFDFNNTYHETYPTVNSYINNSEISADDNESFVDSVIDNQVDDDNLLDSVDDIQVDSENLVEYNLDESSFDAYTDDNENFVEGYTDDNTSLIEDYPDNNASLIANYPDDNASLIEGYPDDNASLIEDYTDDNASLIDGYTADNESSVEGYTDDNASSIEDYPYDNESFVEGYTDDNASLIEGYPDDNASFDEGYTADSESSFNDVLDTVQEYYDRTSITPTKDDPEWDKLWDEKTEQISKIKPHINELTSRYNNLIEKEEQHKEKNNFITGIKKHNASKEFNKYYNTLISSDHVDPVDEKYLNSQINAAYSAIGHDYYQHKENSKPNSLLSGAKQKSNESIPPKNTSYTISSERLSNLKPARKLIKEKVVVNPNNTGADQGITILERTTSRNHGMTPRINRH